MVASKEEFMRIFVGSLLLSITLTACGSDDSGGGGGGGNSEAASTSCRSYCDADQAAMCGLYASAQECYDFECEFNGAPQACLDALKTYYDCSSSASDVCDDQACSAEATAYFNACAV